MAYAVIVTADLVWIPDGAGPGVLGQNQSNQPGYGSGLTPGPIGNAQSMRLAVTEVVAGGDTLTQGNLNTALTTGATDLGTLFGTAGAFGGNPATPTSLATAWATGGP